MIYSNMRNYDYYLYKNNNDYGQPELTEDIQGSVKMSIYTTSTALQENILYKNCSYIGLTNDAEVNDTYVIDYEGKRLKVLYVLSRGRFKQVFMAGM